MPFELIPKMTDHSLYAHCVRKCSGNHVSNGFVTRLSAIYLLLESTNGMHGNKLNLPQVMLLL
jgi:hypothetical protein